MRRAVRSRRQVNLGWFLESFTPLSIASSVALALIVFIARSQGRVLDLRTSWPWLLLVLALVGFVSWLKARRQMETTTDNLVRLEGHSRMDNALSAADAGVRDWPEVPEVLNNGVSWRWHWFYLPILTGLACLVAAFTIPVSSVEAGTSEVVEPLAWQQMESWLETLEENELVDEESVESFAEDLQALRQTPEEDWFEHSVMEASDTLREQLGHAIDRLDQDARTAEQSLNALQNFAEQLSPEARERLAGEYGKALESMESNGLPLDESLKEAMKEIDPSQLSGMDQEQLDALRQRLREQAAALPERGTAGGEEEGLTSAEQELQDLIDEFNENSGFT
ncbi:MAG: hypothetical protein AAF514_04175 [Verrucomicrobiota bacterium]